MRTLNIASRRTAWFAAHVFLLIALFTLGNAPASASNFDHPVLTFSGFSEDSHPCYGFIINREPDSRGVACHEYQVWRIRNDSSQLAYRVYSNEGTSAEFSAIVPFLAGKFGILPATALSISDTRVPKVLRTALFIGEVQMYALPDFSYVAGVSGVRDAVPYSGAPLFAKGLFILRRTGDRYSLLASHYTHLPSHQSDE